MGGTLAVLLCCLPQRFAGLRFAIIGGARDLPTEVFQQLDIPHCNFSGVDSDHRHEEHLICVPSLHLIGAADKVVPPDSSTLLASRFKSAQIIHHEQGHCIP